MLKVLDIDLDQLRSDVAASARVESADRVQLRRFSVGSVLRIALPAAAPIWGFFSLRWLEQKRYL